MGFMSHNENGRVISTNNPIAMSRSWQEVLGEGKQSSIHHSDPISTRSEEVVGDVTEAAQNEEN